MLERGYCYKLNIKSCQTMFDLTEREAIKEYNKMWNRVANWP